MKNPNRKKKTFKLQTPIVYELEDGGTQEIHEFDIYQPFAGQIKEIGPIEGLDYKQVINLTANCSEMTVPMLDLMTYDDLNGLCEVILDFLSPGPKSAAKTS